MSKSFYVSVYFSVAELIASRKMSDDNKPDAECNNKEQVNDSSSTPIDVAKPSSKCDKAEQTELLLSELFDESDEKLVNTLNGLQKDCIQVRNDLKNGDMATMRKTNYDRAMQYDRWRACKKMFDELLDDKKVSDHDRKSKTLNELYKMLTKPKSLYEERAAFYKAHKSLEESLDQYFQRLTDLSSNCQFGERLSAVLADKFILSQTNIYYAFCGEGQKEVCGKNALKIAKQNYDKDLVP